MFGKKRGHRHTGSKTLGSAGEALFFALLLLAGTAFLVLLLARKVVPEWRANHEFLQLTAVALDKRIGESHDSDGNTVYRPEVKISYEVDGEQLRNLDVRRHRHLVQQPRRMSNRWSIKSKSAANICAGTIRSSPTWPSSCAATVGGSG